MSTDLERKDLPAGTSGKAIASLIFGMISFCVPVLLSIPGLIFGIVSLVNISSSQDRLKGRGMAIAGIVCSSLSLVFSPVYLGIMIGLLLPAVQKVREAANRVKSQNNFKMLAIANFEYADRHGAQWPATISDPNNRPLLSWRVNVLPYIEEDGRYRQFKLDEPWDSVHNRPLLDPRPKWLSDPALMPNGQPIGNQTPYRTFVGPGTLFSSPGYQTPYTLANIPDGTSNTILIVEAADGVPWSKPEELLVPRGPIVPMLGNPQREMFIVAMADGSVRGVKKTVSEQTLRSAINPADGMVLGPDW
jgi:hypothetical protein